MKHKLERHADRNSRQFRSVDQTLANSRQDADYVSIWPLIIALSIGLLWWGLIVYAGIHFLRKFW